MNWKEEIKYILAGTFVFLFFYFFPSRERIISGAREGLLLAHWYAKEHVILCLIPAFFIAGAISVFISQDAVMKYLGPKAPKAVSYSVASVSGTILAVCSCTVLPLFASIYMRGAGLGPATAFLYSGPAINILAIVLTARVLGLKIGVARAIGAVGASIIIGLIMALLFKGEEQRRLEDVETVALSEDQPLWQSAIFMATLVAILIFSTWGHGTGIWERIWHIKWYLVSFFVVLLLFEMRWMFDVQVLWLLGVVLSVTVFQLTFKKVELSFLAGVIVFSLALYFTEGKAREWLESSYWLAKQILPLLFIGVVVAGFLLGRPGSEGFIPSKYVASVVGGNSIISNFFASIVGAFMYFATLTEVPILQGLMGAGMGKGPALALLLSGPAVSLPNMLVIRSVLGTKKTVAYVSLVVIISTISGWLFGLFA